MALNYRSHAVEPMSEAGLRGLETLADARNRSEGITGVMIYDDGHFFQWLEGPEAGVARVWNSVQRDRRHHDIQLSSLGPAPSRSFGDTGMKLLRRADPLWSASALLATSLPSLVESVVVPALAGHRREQVRALPAIDPRVAELASLLLATDPTASAVLARELAARAGPLAFARASLFDPTARSLGDLWYDDDCSGLELDLALMRMKDLVHEQGEASPATSLRPFEVLVAPQPGESHLLGAALDTELLGQAGWNAHAEFPATDDALQALVAGEWFDALDLSLSSALRREDAVLRLERTIATARLASQNPALVVVVGGRVFTEPGRLASSVGADVNASQVLRLEAAIEEVLRRPRSTERRRERPASAEKRRENDDDTNRR
ncbi:MAG: BLUF domain-containing protein [Myxococcales bacterium]|nr:BLUF domain-containing protein [Myxococcales bacterium]MDP3498863.1 BLUF domain-containing protein [Myxococcales bacterium]